MKRFGSGRQLVICGLGGQGIVFLSRVVAGAALFEGERVLTAESHGMSQRGGAVEAHLKLGVFESSLVRRGSANGVLVLHPDRLDAARPLLGPQGIAFANARGEMRGVRTVDASGAALQLEFPRGQNLVLLGYAVATEPELFPSAEAILTSLDRLSPPPAADLNRRAFGRGADLA